MLALAFWILALAAVLALAVAVLDAFNIALIGWLRVGLAAVGLGMLAFAALSMDTVALWVVFAVLAASLLASVLLVEGVGREDAPAHPMMFSQALVALAGVAALGWIVFV